MGEGSAMRGARTVDFDAPDRAHKLDGFQRATRLLAGPKQAERRGVRACDLIDHHRRGGTDPHTGQSEFVHERERPLPGQPAPMQLASVLGLTERQLDVLVLMTQGRSNKAIANGHTFRHSQRQRQRKQQRC